MQEVHATPSKLEPATFVGLHSSLQQQPTCCTPVHQQFLVHIRAQSRVSQTTRQDDLPRQLPNIHLETSPRQLHLINTTTVLEVAKYQGLAAEKNMNSATSMTPPSCWFGRQFKTMFPEGTKLPTQRVNESSLHGRSSRSPMFNAGRPELACTAKA